MSDPKDTTAIVLNEKSIQVQDVSYEEIPMDLMAKGNFLKLREILQGKEKVKYMGLLLEALEANIKVSQKEAADIKERGWFDRLKSNNVNDIGKILSNQNIVIACLFVLMQLQSWSIESNAEMLATLCAEVDKESQNSTDESSSIKQIVRDVLESNKLKIERDELRDKALMKLLKAAENSREFENAMRDALQLVKEEYHQSEQKLNAINVKNQQELLKQIETLKATTNTRLADSERTYNNNFEELHKRLTKTVITFSIITLLFFIGLIISFLI